MGEFTNEMKTHLRGRERESTHGVAASACRGRERGRREERQPVSQRDVPSSSPIPEKAKVKVSRLRTRVNGRREIIPLNALLCFAAAVSRFTKEDRSAPQLKAKSRDTARWMDAAAAAEALCMLQVKLPTNCRAPSATHHEFVFLAGGSPQLPDEMGTVDFPKSISYFFLSNHGSVYSLGFACQSSRNAGRAAQTPLGKQLSRRPSSGKCRWCRHHATGDAYSARRPPVRMT